MNESNDTQHILLHRAIEGMPSTWDYMSGDYSNLDMAVFIGCDTGYNGVDGNSVASRAVELGAEVSIGFDESILCSAANYWTEMFYTRMLLGDSVNDAMLYMQLFGTGDIRTITNAAVVYGNSDYKLLIN